jgi:hypothetical protein
MDDFYQVLERLGGSAPQLPCGGEEKQYRSKLSLSEVTTIVIAVMWIVNRNVKIPLFIA